MTFRSTHARPLGKLPEYLEGPLAGSKMFVYYVPFRGGTEVRVLADLRYPTMRGGELEVNVRDFLSYEFEERKGRALREVPVMRSIAPATRRGLAQG
jgi:hypothetical protein